MTIKGPDSSGLYHFSVYLATIMAEMRAEMLELGCQRFQIKATGAASLPCLRLSIWFEMLPMWFSSNRGERFRKEMSR